MTFELNGTEAIPRFKTNWWVGRISDDFLGLVAPPVSQDSATKIISLEVRKTNDS